MPRVYLPLLPLPVLAVIVAVSACSKPRSGEPTMHVIPPAAPYTAPGAIEPRLPATDARAAMAAAGTDPAPSAKDVEEFERPVRK